MYIYLIHVVVIFYIHGLFESFNLSILYVNISSISLSILITALFTWLAYSENRKRKCIIEGIK
jgi:hypothetical protein